VPPRFQLNHLSRQSAGIYPSYIFQKLAIGGQLPGMRLFQAPPALLSSVALLLAYSRPSRAASDRAEIVLDSENPGLQLQISTLAKRWAECPSGACGDAQTYCCNTNAGSYCYTDANSVATCLTSGWAAQTTPAATLATATGNGYYTYWTSTTVETDTITKTYVYSSWVPITTQVGVESCPMDWAGMTTPCGGICCETNQYCNFGTCTSNSGVYTVTGASATAGTRGTSVTGVIVTSTISPTVTTAFGTPVPAASGNVTMIPTAPSHLSGGAIAGIVIGVIAGIILLLLICLVCCLRAGIDSILALLGLRNRRRRRGRVVEEEEIIERRRRRSGTTDSRRWYGASAEGRPARTTTSVTRIEEQRRRTGGLGGLAAVTAGLGGLALALGLKRRADERKRRRDDKSETESSYYYSSSYYDSLSGK